MRRRQWFTSERVEWPAGALRKYYEIASRFIADNRGQKPVQEAITLITEIVNGNFSRFSPTQYDQVLQEELYKRSYLQDRPIEALSRLLGFWLFFKEYPTQLPDTDHGIKPYFVYSFFGTQTEMPGTRARLALMNKLFLFYSFFEKSHEIIMLTKRECRVCD